VTYGQGDHSILYYAAASPALGTPTFGNFRLRLKFMVSTVNDNSGIFLRFRYPLFTPTAEILARDRFNDIPRSQSWVAVYSGFEVQIDDQGKADPRYGEAERLKKNSTGAIYKIPAGDPGEPAEQQYTKGPALQPNQWFEYDITVV